jgi:hypothetical protein
MFRSRVSFLDSMTSLALRKREFVSTADAMSIQIGTKRFCTTVTPYALFWHINRTDCGRVQDVSINQCFLSRSHPNDFRTKRYKNDFTSEL